MKRRAWGLKWKKTLYWIIWNRFQDNAFGIRALKGKFSSGREGALASKFNYVFK